MPRRINRKPKPAQPASTIVDRYKEMLGYKPSPPTPLFTSANVLCGRCGQIKPGREFAQPISFPSACRECA